MEDCIKLVLPIIKKQSTANVLGTEIHSKWGAFIDFFFFFVKYFYTVDI